MNWKRVAVALVALCLPFAVAQPAEAAPACDAPAPSTTRPGYLVADPDCDFTALPGARVFTGVRAGAAYRIEVPQAWNGTLVVYAHGYRGDGNTVYVSDPELRSHYIQRGFAWAASSYATNGYDVAQGVTDSVALIDVFRRVTKQRARSVLMSGASMGGHITAVAIEDHPRAFAGAMPYCGVLGDTALFDYFLDANLTAAALAGVPADFPVEEAAWRGQVQRILPALGLPAGSTAAGRLWSGVVERRSGGERPGFDSAFAYWNTARSLEPFADLPFLFGLYPGLTGGTMDIAPANVTSNDNVLYRSNDDWWPPVDDWRLNVTVKRVHRAVPPDVGVPRVWGRPTVPVLSLHDIGDLFVPFSMEQEYASRAARNGRSGLFVSRAIRGVGHCDFTPAELRQGFDDLVSWVRTGLRPEGDAILDRRAVADPLFGCRWTSGVHAGFVAPACPSAAP